MQIDLLKCTFDMWLCNSSRSLETSLVTSVSIEENITFVESIRHTLIDSFELCAQHYVCLLVERANMDVIAVVSDEAASVNTTTTKEMRKQMKKVTLLDYVIDVFLIVLNL